MAAPEFTAETPRVQRALRITEHGGGFIVRSVRDGGQDVEFCADVTALAHAVRRWCTEKEHAR